MQPSQAYVDEAKHHPCLVKKHAENSLILPEGIEPQNSLLALRSNGAKTSLYFNKIEV